MEFEVRRAYGILGKDQVHKTLIRNLKGICHVKDMVVRLQLNLKRNINLLAPEFYI